VVVAFIEKRTNPEGKKKDPERKPEGVGGPRSHLRPNPLRAEGTIVDKKGRGKPSVNDRRAANGREDDVRL